MHISFAEHQEIVAGLSERAHGSMTWWNRLPLEEATARRRAACFAREGIREEGVVSGGLVHGVRVAEVKEAAAGRYLLDTDALITRVRGLFLTVSVADCAPIFFVDHRSEAVGIAHAGWRGAVAGIAEKTVAEMTRAFGSRPADIVAVIGPCIHSCHYDVGEDVAARFLPTSLTVRSGRIFADLPAELTARLHAAHVGTITTNPTCTFCHATRFYSARHDQTKPVEGMVAYIGIRSV